MLREAAAPASWSEPEDARIEREHSRRRRRPLHASQGSMEIDSRRMSPASSPGKKLLMARARRWGSPGGAGGTGMAASVDGRMQRRHSSPRQRTVHDEVTDVPISSDDSSDDDEVYSRASRKSRSTVHREANGIWVSSDDESDDDAMTPRNWRARRTTRHTSSFRDPDARSFSAAVGAHSPQTNGRIGVPSRSHQEQHDHTFSTSPQSRYQQQPPQQLPYPHYQSHPENAASWRNPTEATMSPNSMPVDQQWQSAQRQTQQLQNTNPSPSASSHNSRYWSSSSSETSSVRGNDTSTLRFRRRHASSTFGMDPTAHLGGQQHQQNGYESLDSISLASTTVSDANGYASAASSDRWSMQRARPAPSSFRSSGLSQGSSCSTWTSTQQQQQEQPSLFVFSGQREIQCSYPSSSASAGVGVATGTPLTSATPVITAETIQLHAVQFWDPDGTRALIADRGSIGGGLAIGFGLIAFGSWMWGCALIAVTVLTASYLSTIYRLSKWRASSGIEQQALFNDMYEIVEQTCTDTRVTLPSGEMRPRLVCAGELGTALERNFPGLTGPLKLRFWTEACVHFRLTLRSGCHHLGHGKLHPRHLSTSTLGTMTKQLPTGICPSCDNKIAIEARFPLKYE